LVRAAVFLSGIVHSREADIFPFKSGKISFFPFCPPPVKVVKDPCLSSRYFSLSKSRHFQSSVSAPMTFFPSGVCILLTVSFGSPSNDSSLDHRHSDIVPASPVRSFPAIRNLSPLGWVQIIPCRSKVRSLRPLTPSGQFQFSPWVGVLLSRRLTFFFASFPRSCFLVQPG